MRISKYLHSCLLVEKQSDRILFDPGKFSFVEGLVEPESFPDLTAILLTHDHPDHVDSNILKTITQDNPSAVVLTNREAQANLARAGIRAEIFESGVRSVGSFAVTAMEAPHMPVLGSTPPQNTAFLVDGVFLNPGDSFADSLTVWRETPVLALPVMAPWSNELNVAAFALRMSPRRIVPVHDGQAKDFFLEQRYTNYRKYFAAEGIAFEWMTKPGDQMEIA